MKSGSGKYGDIDIGRRDLVLAVGALLCGFLFWEFTGTSRGVSVIVFTAVVCITGGIYLKSMGASQNGKSIICLIFMGVLAAPFAIFDWGTERTLGIFALAGVYIYWIAVTAGTRIDNRLSVYTVCDGIRQMILMPFGNFGSCPILITRSVKSLRSGKTALFVAIGIIAAIPVMIVVLTLLISADPVFGKMLSGLSAVFSLSISKYVWECILGIPVAFYLCGLIFGNGNKLNTGRLNSKDDWQGLSSRLHSIPSAVLYTIMTVLNVTYLTFIMLQASYLFSAFKDMVPDGMTYAQCARSGFFQLCAVAAINLAVVAFVYLFADRKEGRLSGIMRAEIAIISLFTICLGIVAFRKMFLYIDAYGLTQLRIFTSLFMLLLIVTFAVTALSQLRSFNGARVVILAGAIMMLVLLYGNIDGQIAKYNINRYEAGTLELMDKYMMYDLSSGAVPYLYEAYKNTDDPAAKADLYFAITGVEQGGDDMGLVKKSSHESWKNMNIQQYRANKIRKELRSE